MQQRKDVMLICTYPESQHFSSAALALLTPVTIGRGSDMRTLGYALMMIGM